MSTTTKISKPRHLPNVAGGSITTIEIGSATYLATQYPYSFAELHSAAGNLIAEARKEHGHQWQAHEDPERHHNRTGHTAERPSRHQPHSATGSSAEEALARIAEQIATEAWPHHYPTGRHASTTPAWARLD